MEADIGRMVGETMVSVSGLEKGATEIVFVAESGRRFQFYHEQDCCEHVQVEDVTGNPLDLVGSPLLMAREDSNEGAPTPQGVYAESFTWTFYSFATVKGHVTVRWLGESNGYYSEAVRLAVDEVS